MTATIDILSPSSPSVSDDAAAASDHIPTTVEFEKPVTNDQTAKLVILSVNDVYDLVPNDHGHGGIAEFATLLEHHKAAVPQDVTLLVTLNGDFLSGSEIAERFKGYVGFSMQLRTNQPECLFTLVFGLL